MKRKGKNSEKKEKKEINGRFTHKLSRQGFFCNGSPILRRADVFPVVASLFLEGESVVRKCVCIPRPP